MPSLTKTALRALTIFTFLILETFTLICLLDIPETYAVLGLAFSVVLHLGAIVILSSRSGR